VVSASRRNWRGVLIGAVRPSTRAMLQPNVARRSGGRAIQEGREPAWPYKSTTNFYAGFAAQLSRPIADGDVDDRSIVDGEPTTPEAKRSATVCRDRAREPRPPPRRMVRMAKIWSGRPTTIPGRREATRRCRRGPPWASNGPASSLSADLQALLVLAESEGIGFGASSRQEAWDSVSAYPSWSAVKHQATALVGCGAGVEDAGTAAPIGTCRRPQVPDERHRSSQPTGAAG
jgi:hypothetical protein